MELRTVSGIFLACAATAAFAHEGVMNPLVKQRMDAMSEIAANLKSISNMARGNAEFDAETARGLLSEVSRHGGKIPVLFEKPESDPKSEAKDLIWQDFDTFSKIAVDLKQVAEGLAQTVATVEDLGPAMAALATTCRQCHSSYRE